MDLFSEFIEQIAERVANKLSDREKPSLKAENPLDERILTREQLAELFGISLVTIYKHMKTGKLPYFRMGRRIYFRYSEVMENLPHFKNGR